jgi:histidyl-tRNA synthetase
LIKAVKGTRDLLPPSTEVWNRVEAVARAIFRAYNYHEIRTPIFEETQLFARGVGAETDIVTKEMYTFVDRDDSSLTLRPENTASVIRAYIEHRLDQRPGIQKLYYIGPMFRRERPQKGRYRQFYQIGAEAIGSESPMVDAEVIGMVIAILEGVGLSGFQLLINSVGDANCRPQYVERLRQELKDVAPLMCGDCQRRAETNPLRVLDCKVPTCRAAMQDAPVMLDHLCEACAAHFGAVCALLDGEGVKYQLAPRLVRGLDYYNRTAFEITAAGLGAQDAVAGGGRYDGLVAQLGGPDVPAFGFAIGVERLALAAGLAIEPPVPSVAILPLVAEAAGPALSIATRLRAGGITVLLEPPGRSLKALLRNANRRQARAALLLGGDELAAGRGTVRDLVRGVDHRLALPLDAGASELVRWVREHEEGESAG